MSAESEEFTGASQALLNLRLQKRVLEVEEAKLIARLEWLISQAESPSKVYAYKGLSEQCPDPKLLKQLVVKCFNRLDELKLISK
jgi:hypothetical protein